MHFNYTALETVVSNESAAVALPLLVERLNARRVFLVSSASLAEATDDLLFIRDALGSRCVGMSTGIRAHTPREDVLTVLAEVRASNADLLVSLGGGSIIDGCKAIQLALEHGLETAEQLQDFAQRADGTRGARAGNDSFYAKQSNIRQIAIPTTLSGAEFSCNAGVLDTEQNAKEGYRSASLCPKIVIHDPQLTRHTPQWLFLSTAIRALDHAVEGFCSKHSSPYHDGHFLHAMTLFQEALPRCVSNPDDEAARALAQQAVWLACCGLGSVSHGASHGIGYILGSLCGIPHGYTSCVMLPAVLEWNGSVLSERGAQIASALGRPELSPAQAVKSLIKQLSLPVCLQALGVQKDSLEQIAARALQHPVVGKNPKPLHTVEQVTEILELAWD